MSGVPPLPRPKLDAAYYRRRAQESRDLAGRVQVASIRRQLLEMAEGYERMAERTAAWEDDPRAAARQPAVKLQSG